MMLLRTMRRRTRARHAEQRRPMSCEHIMSTDAYHLSSLANECHASMRRRYSSCCCDVFCSCYHAR